MSFYFNDLSKELTAILTKEDKRQNGIYFSPPTDIQNMLSKLNITPSRILEPSCGSLEIFNSCKINYPNATIYGYEKNHTIYEKIKETDNIYNEDFLTSKHDICYDLIIGNPPFFVIKNDDVAPEFKKYITGRPNICLLFILKSLTLLSKNGILSFILPNSFLNSIYYDKVRQRIYESYEIKEIFNLDGKYLETQQETFCMIVSNNNNRKDNDSFCIKYNDFHIFSPNIKKLKELLEQSKTLNELECEVKIGNIVWNKHKELLTNDDTKTRLIYSSDIKGNTITISKTKNKEKKPYIDKECDYSNSLIINRGYGVGKYNMDCCLVEGKYLFENNLIVITHSDIELLKNIQKSLLNEKTKEFIKIMCGNNAINTTELKHIIPIYI